MGIPPGRNVENRWLVINGAFIICFTIYRWVGTKVILYLSYEQLLVCYRPRFRE